MKTRHLINETLCIAILLFNIIHINVLSFVCKPLIPYFKPYTIDSQCLVGFLFET